MIPQEIFNKAYLGLKAQGRMSYKKAGGMDCAYCGENGAHCGIGFLVTPEVGELWDASTTRDYGTAIITVVSRKLPGVEDWMVENLTLLDAIQRAHDRITHWNVEFEREFACVAREHNLEVPA